MEISDMLLCRNRDWDPSYFREILDQDFFDFNDMWASNVNDSELVAEVDKYCPITEDITIEDNVLCSAVEQIEEE